MNNTTFFRKAIENLFRIVDFIILPLTFLSAWHLKMLRKYTQQRFPLSHRAIDKIGIYPLIDHYYEPLIKTERLKRPIQRKRHLPGIAVDLDITGKELIKLLDKRIPDDIPDKIVQDNVAGTPVYYYCNQTFGPLDAITFYALIRQQKPNRIIEIGCGMSTLIARKAIEDELKSSPEWICHHTAIEPYENDWLESLGVDLLRIRVEECEPNYFDSLQSGDILFIDCSHVIRPQGEVLYLIQKVLGRLNPGVLVHIHDICTPYDYPDHWLETFGRFWNEQYLVEAYLAFNNNYEILYPLAALWLEQKDTMTNICPPADRVQIIQPTSFWIRRKA